MYATRCLQGYVKGKVMYKIIADEKDPSKMHAESEWHKLDPSA